MANVQVNNAAMDELETLLPGITDFLRSTLTNEKLSITAEEKRRALVERIDDLTQPPTPPPRPNDLPKPVTNEDFIRRQREWSRENAPVPQMNGGEDLYEDCNGIDGEEQQDTGNLNGVNGSEHTAVEDVEDEQLYEEPCITDEMLDMQNSDTGSVTSYESYTDGEFDDGPEYENQNFKGLTPTEDIPLPSIEEDYENTGYFSKRKTKKKKKKRSSDEEEVCARLLPNASFRGELSQKGFISLSRLYCLIRDNMLLCFKSEKDTRPLIRFLLCGYDVVYLEKDGKYNHALRISHPGCETHMFYADCKESAQEWLEHMMAASCGQEVASGSGDGSISSGKTSTSISRKGSNSSSHGNSQQQQQATTATPGLQGEEAPGGSSSEGGSADGVIRAPSPTPSDPTKRSKGFSLGNIFSIGRKKGDKMKKMMMEVEDFDAGPDVVIAAWLNVMDSGKKWYRRYCMVRHNTLECFKEPGEEPHDFCMSLAGVKLETAAKETKRELAIKLSSDGKEKLFIEPGNPLEQGDWLKVLITESGATPQEKNDSPHCGKDVIEEAKNDQKPAGRGTPPPLPKTAPPIGRRRQKSPLLGTNSLLNKCASRFSRSSGKFTLNDNPSSSHKSLSTSALDGVEEREENASTATKNLSVSFDDSFNGTSQTPTLKSCIAPCSGTVDKSSEYKRSRPKSQTSWYDGIELPERDYDCDGFESKDVDFKNGTLANSENGSSSVSAEDSNKEIGGKSRPKENVSFGNTTYAIIDLPEIPEDRDISKLSNTSKITDISNTHYAEIVLADTIDPRKNRPPPIFTPPPPPPVNHVQLTNEVSDSMDCEQEAEFGIPPAFADAVLQNNEVRDTAEYCSNTDSLACSIVAPCSNPQTPNFVNKDYEFHLEINRNNSNDASPDKSTDPYMYVDRILSYKEQSIISSQQQMYDCYSNVLNTACSNLPFTVDANSVETTSANFDSAYNSPSTISIASCSTNQDADNISVTEFMDNPVYLLLPPPCDDQFSSAPVILDHLDQISFDHTQNGDLDLDVDEAIPEPVFGGGDTCIDEEEYDDVEDIPDQEENGADYYSYADHDGEDANQDEQEVPEDEEYYDDVILRTPEDEQRVPTTDDEYLSFDQEVNNNKVGTEVLYDNNDTGVDGDYVDDEYLPMGSSQYPLQRKASGDNSDLPQYSRQREASTVERDKPQYSRQREVSTVECDTPQYSRQLQVSSDECYMAPSPPPSCSPSPPNTMPYIPEENEDSHHQEEPLRGVTLDPFGRVRMDEHPRQRSGGGGGVSTMKKGGKQRPGLFAESAFVVRTGRMRMEEERNDWNSKEWPESVESQVDDTFKTIKAKMDKEDLNTEKHQVEKNDAKRKPIASSRSAVRDVGWRDRHRDMKEATSANTTDSEDVVKCHSGPTILEDEALLKSHANPILSELRKEKRKLSWSETELDKLTETIGEIKRKIAQTKRKRAQVRGQKLKATKDEEKDKFEDELTQLDKELETAEAELTKIQLLAHEKEANLKRSGSISSDQGSPRPSPRTPKTSSPGSSFSSSSRTSRTVSPATTTTSPSTFRSVRTSSPVTSSALRSSPPSASSSTSSLNSWKSGENGKVPAKSRWQTENSTTSPRSTVSNPPRSTLASGRSTISAARAAASTVRPSLSSTAASGRSGTSPSVRPSVRPSSSSVTSSPTSTTRGRATGVGTRSSTLPTNSVSPRPTTGNQQRSTLPSRSPGFAASPSNGSKESASRFLSNTLSSVASPPKSTAQITSTRRANTRTTSPKGVSTVTKTTTRTGGGGPGKAEAKGVQERLKLWENIGQEKNSSNC